MRSSLAAIQPDPPLTLDQLAERRRLALSAGIAVVKLDLVRDQRRRREIEQEARRQCNGPQESAR